MWKCSEWLCELGRGKQEQDDARIYSFHGGTPRPPPLWGTCVPGCTTGTPSRLGSLNGWVRTCASGGKEPPAQKRLPLPRPPFTFHLNQLCQTQADPRSRALGNPRHTENNGACCRQHLGTASSQRATEEPQMRQRYPTDLRRGNDTVSWTSLPPTLQP